MPGAPAYVRNGRRDTSPRTVWATPCTPRCTRTRHAR
jgi:hypothetical protein